MTRKPYLLYREDSTTGEFKPVRRFWFYRNARREQYRRIRETIRGNADIRFLWKIARHLNY